MYATSIAYDLDGRRRTITYPSILSPIVNGATRSNVTLHYDLTGKLDQVIDLMGSTFTYEYNWRDDMVRHVHAGYAIDSIHYDDIGRPDLHILRTPQGERRHFTLTYDAQGSRLSAADPVVGSHPQFTFQYDGLGQLRRSSEVPDASNPSISSTFVYTIDGLGNVTRSDGAENQMVATSDGSQSATLQASHTQHYFNSLNGRVIGDTSTSDYASNFNYRYDASGNLEWRGRFDSDHLNAAHVDLRSYYDGAGRLAATDSRHAVSAGNYNITFEEYRYDALGRRVAVRARRKCVGGAAGWELSRDCGVSTMRRIIWDGDQLLGEIQVPGGDNDNLEADSVTSAQQSHDGSNLDVTQFFGAVAYTHGLSLDQPVSVTRVNYADAHVYTGGYFAYDPSTFHQYQAFSIVPMWDDLGTWDSYIFNNTSVSSLCETSAPHCVAVQAPSGWSPYAGVATIAPYVWYGSLPFDQNDASKLTYRRNRYYDPMTGRFTQEDPIGLAGGLNLYGFAAGDPVNFSDPFGLNPYVQCRTVNNLGAQFLGYTHCALRVTNAHMGLDVTIELIPDAQNKNRIYWYSAKGEAAVGGSSALYDPNAWVPVSRPAGESEDDLDAAVLESAFRLTQSTSGTEYNHDGSTNSNHFVYKTLKGAGVRPPASAKKGNQSPGLCGGSGSRTGTDCTKP